MPEVMSEAQVRPYIVAITEGAISKPGASPHPTQEHALLSFHACTLPAIFPCTPLGIFLDPPNGISQAAGELWDISMGVL